MAKSAALLIHTAAYCCSVPPVHIVAKMLLPATAAPAPASCSRSYSAGKAALKRRSKDMGAAYGTRHGDATMHGQPSASAMWKPAGAERHIEKQ